MCGPHGTHQACHVPKHGMCPSTSCAHASHMAYAIRRISPHMCPAYVIRRICRMPHVCRICKLHPTVADYWVRVHRDLLREISTFLTQRGQWRPGHGEETMGLIATEAKVAIPRRRANAELLAGRPSDKKRHAFRGEAASEPSKCSCQASPVSRGPALLLPVSGDRID